MATVKCRLPQTYRLHLVIQADEKKNYDEFACARIDLTRLENKCEFMYYTIYRQRSIFGKQLKNLKNVFVFLFVYKPYYTFRRYFWKYSLVLINSARQLKENNKNCTIPHSRGLNAPSSYRVSIWYIEFTRHSPRHIVESHVTIMPGIRGRQNKKNVYTSSNE